MEIESWGGLPCCLTGPRKGECIEGSLKNTSGVYGVDHGRDHAR